ncbi:hypothetical protein [Mycobacterium kansasii]|uniref:hypothetical protein n=1 Tax=Mycobacterium kansasii TaxID=1768 RepID=UPI0004D9EB2A|nr:hypothetical protein [Mycobacterium kansasii]KEP41879.1 hypothetical protein MKSMC1_28770 [Mycobacterium kansasii]
MSTPQCLAKTNAIHGSALQELLSAANKLHASVADFAELAARTRKRFSAPSAAVAPTADANGGGP